jgi:hypothetical protein
VLRAVVCATLAAPAGVPAFAQQTGPSQAHAAQDPDPFQGVVYPQASVLGEVTLRSARVHEWSQGGTRRLVLEDGVAVRIATYTFRAERAAVWIKEIGRSPDNRTVVQVFAYLDEVGEAGEAAGQTTINARTLPVRAVVELASDISLTSDAAFARALEPARASAERALLDAAESAFTTSLRSNEDPAPAGVGYDFTPTLDTTAKARRWVAQPPARSAPQSPRPPAQPIAEPPVRADIAPSADPTPATPEHATPFAPQPQPVPESLPPSPPLVARQAPTPKPVIVPLANTTEQLLPEPTPTPAPPASQPAASRPAPRPDPIFATSGTLTISSGDITYLTTPTPAPAPAREQPQDTPTSAIPTQESAVIATGGVTVLYRDLRGRGLQLSAQRAVIFLATSESPAPLSGPLPASNVRGIYLEGAVTASDGAYTIRSPQVFYDLARDKAVMLDAVFSTYSQERGVPLYVRAKEIRQESARQWTAQRAVFTNSAFENPELSIGAGSVTIEQRTRAAADTTSAPQPGGSEKYFWATARGVTIRAAGVPFFYWPTYAGDPSQPLLKDLRVENRSGSGVAVRTSWNAAQLLGFDAPEGTSIDLLADAYLERGLGLGARVRWDLARHGGEFFAYGLPLDNGTDLLKPGTTIDRTDDFRGILSLQDRFVLDRAWTITAEGSYISDEAFIDAFFEESGEARREFTNRLTATRREDNTILAAELKTTFNDFIANEWLLQSPGYRVSKLPELSYLRFADDLLPRDAPGLLTHFHEYRVGAYALALDEVTPRARGFSNDFLSQRAFGLSPDQSIAQALRERGYTEEQISRLDTRQEVTAKLKAGPVHLTPFVTARVTFYDNTFAGFTSSPDGNDATRLWASVGARASTTLTRIYDGVDSPLLDIHRLRHAITPSITLWAAGTNVESSDIPSYDPLVDSLADGRAVRLGLAQTLQTKRGGIGRWVDVDLLKLNTDVVFSSDDTDPATPLGRFFDSRPEYAALGNYFTADAAYRMTDATSLVGSTVYDFDTHQQDMSSAGLMVTHSPGWSTLVDVRYINPQDSTIVGLWGNYDLFDKYAITLAPSYDAAEGRFQSVFVQFTRRFSALQMSLGVSYNDITSETTFGFVIQPYGARRGAGVEGLGSTQFTGVYGGGSGGL